MAEYYEPLHDLAASRKRMKTPDTEALAMRTVRGQSIAHAQALYENRRNPKSTQDMRGHLDAAHADTSALRATAVLSDYLNQWNGVGRRHLPEAEAAVRQALAIDRTHHLAHYAKGFMHRARGEHRAALAAFTTAVKHNPDFPHAHAQRGAELLYLGRPKDAVSEVQKAIKLSPRSPSLGMFYWIIGRAEFFMGQYTAAIPWLQRSVRLLPDLWYNRLYLVSAYALSGKQAATKRELDAFNRRFSKPKSKYTLKRVIANERTNPNKHKFVVAGRRRFHEGLRLAGMSP
jgi:tetratricopeptide (TPR) repeat protein